MINKKKMILLSLLTYLFSFSEEIPNTLILDNPNKPITTVETMKIKEKAELNLNIKKITSSSIDTYINKDKRLISFVLDEILEEEELYLSPSKNIFNKNNTKIIDSSNDYKIEKKDYSNKIIVFKYNTLPQELYLIKYNKYNNKLVKLYKWEEKNTNYISDQNGNITVSFTEDYIPFEIINFSQKKIFNNKGKLEVKDGSYLKIDPLLTKNIVMKNSKGEVLDIINLKNGNGSLKLDDSKKGIILEQGSSILNFGIGFKNNEIYLQIKGTTDSSKEYPLRLSVMNIDGINQEYYLNIKPAEYSLKILNETLNFDFRKAQKVMNLKSEVELLSREVILIDSKGLDIKVEFSNNGLVKLNNKEYMLNGHLEAILETEASDKQIKNIQVIGKINENDLKQIPSGDYSGSAELIITVDS